jgi:hypothetical protein
VVQKPIAGCVDENCELAVGPVGAGHGGGVNLSSSRPLVALCFRCWRQLWALFHADFKTAT